MMAGLLSLLRLDPMFCIYQKIASGAPKMAPAPSPEDPKLPATPGHSGTSPEVKSAVLCPNFQKKSAKVLYGAQTFGQRVSFSKVWALYSTFANFSMIVPPPSSGDHHHKDSTEGRAPRARPRQPRLKGLGSQAQRTAQESCDWLKTAQDPSQRIAMCPGDAPSGFVSPQLPGGEVGPAIGSSVPPCSAGYCLLEGRGVMQVPPARIVAKILKKWTWESFVARSVSLCHSRPALQWCAYTSCHSRPAQHF